MRTIKPSGEYANTIVDVTNSNCTPILGVIHEITCYLLIDAAPGATRRNGLLSNQYKCYKTDEAPIVSLMCFFTEHVFTCFYLLQAFVGLHHKNM